ncbi:hypothetical protein LEP1GSC047_0375 [Leptospira inadai serovar Lyme str. 10]|uniref:Uncharacterized protein n=1 Tax=Leptospira inadai serovar Lyme str. 10 TaxID=1049790 RepID=V6HBL9_9LEPT|nr:hypothetical protein [Leptospira inadai]EQA36048.1 hypothetical protein LEP1GSC047_0375 [Leptospira inadai serovar Lyme str. 10]
MELNEKLLYHQIHPLELCVDFSTGLFTTYLAWFHLPVLSLSLPAGFLDDSWNGRTKENIDDNDPYAILFRIGRCWVKAIGSLVIL